MSRSTKAMLLGAAVLGASVLVPGAGNAADPIPGPGSCESGTLPGGEWRSYGGGLTNERAQRASTTVNPGTVANMKPAWIFNAGSQAQAGTLGGGTFQNTPVVADGCVYLASNSGFVFALNAKDGKRVWTSPRLGTTAAGGLLGGVITGSPSVANGKVYVAVAGRHHPRVVALNQSDGSVAWDTEALDPMKRPGCIPAQPQTCDPNKSYSNNMVAAPSVWGDVVFVGIMAHEDAADPRGAYAILDAHTGALLVQNWTISDAEYAAGYRGASVWCTAAVDAETGYAYACGGNPASKQIEAKHSNALLKIDLMQVRNGQPNPDFGEIVAAFKGNVDQYYPGLDRQPACDTIPTTLVWSPTCVQTDLDFGASPSLFSYDITYVVGGETKVETIKLLGDLQKSGVYYAVHADSMLYAWSTVVGAPGPTFNAGSPAADGATVYTAAVPPGQMVALSEDRGRYRWVAPIGTGPATHFQSVSVANGVVFTMDNLGELHAFDAATGLLIRRWPLAVDTGSYAGDLSSQGVSIANNTVYAASSSFVVAYRP